ncbi:MAG: exodeoxyribonuclease VII large subunit, partial [Microthrixaceae bacterium]|nr:exodeoxyribonuclease VII large subunit [Microthrixaceae bacterium]
MSQVLSNAAEYTVSEIAQAVRRTVEDEFGNVKVRGEISGFRGQHASGHAYFTLKDENAS